jgi:hypothetical protein
LPFSGRIISGVNGIPALKLGLPFDLVRSDDIKTDALNITKCSLSRRMGVKQKALSGKGIEEIREL